MTGSFSLSRCTGAGLQAGRQRVRITKRAPRLVICGSSGHGSSGRRGASGRNDPWSDRRDDKGDEEPVPQYAAHFSSPAEGLNSNSTAEDATQDTILETEVEIRARSMGVPADNIYEVSLSAERTPCADPIMDFAHASFQDQVAYLSSMLGAIPVEVCMQMLLQMRDRPAKLLRDDGLLIGLGTSMSLRRDFKEGFNPRRGWNRYQMARVLDMLLRIDSEDLFLHVGLSARMYNRKDPVYPAYNPTFLGTASASFCTSEEFAVYTAVGRALLGLMAESAERVRRWAGLARALRQYPSGFPMCELRSTVLFCPEYTRALDHFPTALKRAPTIEAFMRHLVSIVGGSGPYEERQAVARLLFIVGPRVPKLEGHIGYFSVMDPPAGASRFGVNPPDHIVQEYLREYNQSRGSKLLLQLYR